MHNSDHEYQKIIFPVVCGWRLPESFLPNFTSPALSLLFGYRHCLPVLCRPIRRPGSNVVQRKNTGAYGEVWPDGTWIEALSSYEVSNARQNIHLKGRRALYGNTPYEVHGRRYHGWCRPKHRSGTEEMNPPAGIPTGIYF